MGRMKIERKGCLVFEMEMGMGMESSDRFNAISIMGYIGQEKFRRVLMQYK